MLLPQETPPEGTAGAAALLPFGAELCCVGAGDCPPLTSNVWAFAWASRTAAKRKTLARFAKIFFTGLLCQTEFEQLCTRNCGSKLPVQKRPEIKGSQRMGVSALLS